MRNCRLRGTMMGKLEAAPWTPLPDVLGAFFACTIAQHVHGARACSSPRNQFFGSWGLRTGACMCLEWAEERTCMGPAPARARGTRFRACTDAWGLRLLEAMESVFGFMCPVHAGPHAPRRG